jgi:hypothetical protein
VRLEDQWRWPAHPQVVYPRQYDDLMALGYPAARCSTNQSRAAPLALSKSLT